MTLEDAIALAEDPLRLAAAAEEEQLTDILDEMQRLFAKAESAEVAPLAWQAFRARAARRSRSGALDQLDVATAERVRALLS